MGEQSLRVSGVATGKFLSASEIAFEGLRAPEERRQRVLAAQGVRPEHQPGEHVGDRAVLESALAKPGLGHQRDQGRHGEPEAPLLGVDGLGHDLGGGLGGHHLHALAAQHEDGLELSRRDLVVALVQGRRPGRRGGLTSDCGNAGQAQAVGDLGGDVGAVLELLAVHDSHLDGVEGAHRRIGQRSHVGFCEEIEDGAEDLAGEVHLRQADARDVDLLGHEGRG
jgi:hypothetical protein